MYLEKREIEKIIELREKGNTIRGIANSIFCATYYYKGQCRFLMANAKIRPRFFSKSISVEDDHGKYQV